MLDHARSAGGCQTLTFIAIGQQFTHCCSKRLGCVCDAKVLAVVCVDALRSSGGADDSAAGGHGFEDFVLHATRQLQRGDRDARPRQFIAHIVDGAYDLEASAGTCLAARAVSEWRSRSTLGKVIWGHDGKVLCFGSWLGEARRRVHVQG